MTQGDLGKALGTSGDIIVKYERGEIKPSIDTVAKVADALGDTGLPGKEPNVRTYIRMLERLQLIEKLPKGRTFTPLQYYGCVLC